MSKQSENSKQWIADALFQLMETAPFSEITNKQITDKAGLSHITIYRNFDSKEEIVEYYLLECLERASLDNAKMDDLFRFYETNKKLISLLYQNHLQYVLLDAILKKLQHDKNDDPAFAYAKVTVAYLMFGWCDEWYKRGMKETPEQIRALLEEQKKG
ncbi:TetR/AcrR family transcriptional regulator [uncultured Dubosiella sp.]|uniref:TetR/AcrR family transcriptional regulator n=1 Tax=uncultured Dubosiella sp. TaxID=1937011 RepID=UPI002731598E|nr:TetR/AcrR family transcriptional regulator [uncultured Dubosiella sp.]